MRKRVKEIAIGLALLHVVIFASADSVIVQWGAPDGSTNIVAASQDFQIKATTFAADAECNPAVGADYYSDADGRSPVFNQVASVSGNTKNITDGGADFDYICTAKNIATYRSLLVWENFLTTDNILTAISAEIRKSTTAATRSVFRWVIEKDGDESGWYASDEIADSSTWTTYSADTPGTLNWHAFDPEQDLDDVSFAETATAINMTNVVTVGFFSESVHDGGYIAHQTRYFQAIAAPAPVTAQPLASYDTGYTIQKVRNAQGPTGEYIVGGSYDGAVVALDYEGAALWTNALSGYMIHDMWCEDLTGDSVDEILIANADGSTYCLNGAGEQQWQFKPNDSAQLPPMYAVCVVHDATDTPYVVCGGFDKSVYYITSAGELEQELKSSSYSSDKPWGDAASVGYSHIANFLRPFPQEDGSEQLAIVGSMNNSQGTGTLYIFEPLNPTPLSTNSVPCTDNVGDFRVRDPDGDGSYELLFGASSLGGQMAGKLVPQTGETYYYPLSSIGPNSYRTTQPETILDGTDEPLYFLFSGNYITLTPDMNTNTVDSAAIERIGAPYAFNDIWKDSSGRILLASAQSGGSCVHVIDPLHADWKEDFKALDPPGKIQTILSNAEAMWTQLETFTKPAWEREPQKVYEGGNSGTHSVAQNITANDGAFTFLNSSPGLSQQEPSWRTDSALAMPEYWQEKRDNRKDYDMTQAEILTAAESALQDFDGIAFWAGHGSDPLYFSLDSHEKMIDLADGKFNMLIWSEMSGGGDDFEYVMDYLFYPLAEYLTDQNGSIFIRNKNIFWSGKVYDSNWSRLLSGEFSEVFVSSMEETNSKTQDLSLAGRLGLWAAGSMDNWGIRCSRDNPCFDRARHFAYQMLPNHFLRQMVYSMACGSTQMQNSYKFGEDHLSLAWELVYKGALFIPEREEIVSFNPVHLSMADPDEDYLANGEDIKWTVYYDREYEENNPFVFGRMNGSWMAAPLNEWDFSNYAAGVKDRRQNFIPPFPRGQILITPPQEGVFADTDAPRGSMCDRLHPLYKNILREYITNGRSYISSDGSVTNAADLFYTTIDDDIDVGVRQLPVSVSGDDVAWVCAQTDPYHLRLTLVDSGYLDPKERTALVSFNTVTPVQIKDLLDGTTWSAGGSSVSIEVPLGLFRFIDIELSEPFFPDNDWGDYASEHGLTGNAQADSDGDGQSDFHEYAFGGDPDETTTQANSPTLQFNADGIVSFINQQRSSASAGVSYEAEWTDDITSETWNTSWWDQLETVQDDLFNEAEYQLETAGSTNLFFRLKATQP